MSDRWPTSKAPTEAGKIPRGRNPGRPSAPARRPPRRLYRRARGNDPHRDRRQRARLGRHPHRPPAQRRRSDADGRGRRPWHAAARPGPVSRRGGEHEVTRRRDRLCRRRHQARAARRHRSGHRNATRRHARGDPLAPGLAVSCALEMDSAPGAHRRARHGGAAQPDQSAVAVARRRLPRGGHPPSLRAAARSRLRRAAPAALRSRDFIRPGRPDAGARGDEIRRLRDHPDPHRPPADPVRDRLPRAARQLGAHRCRPRRHRRQHVRQSHQKTAGTGSVSPRRPRRA